MVIPLKFVDTIQWPCEQAFISLSHGMETNILNTSRDQDFHGFNGYPRDIEDERNFYRFYIEELW